MKILKNNFLFAAFLMLSVALVSCEDDSSTDYPLAGNNYVSLEGPFSKNLSLYPNETVSVQSKVHTSQTSNVDRTYNLAVDAATTLNSAYYVVPSTVTIPAGETVGTFTVQVTGNEIGSGKKLIVGIAQQEGVDVNINSFTETTLYEPGPVNYVNVVATNKLTINIEEKCDFNKCVLTIKFDNYPEETAWELYDATFNLLASGGFDAAGTEITGYLDLGYAPRSTFVTNFCLVAGEYTFVIYDKYGDGMYTSSSIQGEYSLKLNGQTLAAGGGNGFTYFQDTTFTLP